MNRFLEFDLKHLASARPGWAIDYHDELPSTNDRVLRLAADPLWSPPVLVLTPRQTAGRGRGVNRWWSAPGALTFSALLELPAQLAAHRRPQLSLVAALAVREALAEYAPSARVQVKWPNDVFLDQRKVCGILIETSATRPALAVLGIGVNINNSLSTAPPELRASATALCDVSGAAVNLTDALIRLLEQLDAGLERLAGTPTAIVEAWTPHCFLSDRIIQLDVGGRRSMGRCLGIDADGALVLQTSTDVERHVSGIVSHWEA